LLSQSAVFRDTIFGTSLEILCDAHPFGRFFRTYSSKLKAELFAVTSLLKLSGVAFHFFAVTSLLKLSGAFHFFAETSLKLLKLAFLFKKLLNLFMIFITLITSSP
jgi:hypothetical protein